MFAKLSLLLSTAISTEYYYKTINYAFQTFFDEYMMHYPLLDGDNSSFVQCQKNLTDHCLTKIPELKGKVILEVGCGNGSQGIYIFNKFQPAKLTGVDINKDSINIANDKLADNSVKNIVFMVDNAEKLSKIEDNSVDVLINIESAFHYPDKNKFLKEITRILRPDGWFVIADILTVNEDNNHSRIKNFWKKKMNFHHWTLEKYNEGFKNANLILKDSERITNLVINAFEHSHSFIKNHPMKKKLSFKMVKIFFKININLNIRLLKNKRQYYVFSGQKI